MFHIAICCNENYAKFAAVLIHSVVKATDLGRGFSDFCAAPGFSGENSSFQSYKNIKFADFSENERSEGYIFHILGDFFSQKSRENFQNLAQNLSQIYPTKIELHIVDNAEFLGAVPPSYLNSISTFYRYAVARFIPKNVGRVLYLDTDMMAFGDLRELFCIDFAGAMILGTSDLLITQTDKNAKNRHGGADFVFELPSERYFQGGFLMINLPKWRENGVEGRLFEITRDFEIKFGDQDALNFVILGDWLKIPSRFNLLLGALGYEKKPYFLGESGARFNMTRAEILVCERDLVVAHFTFGIYKPWAVFLGDKWQWGARRVYRYIDVWWDLALTTPCFGDEIRAVRGERFKRSVKYWLRPKKIAAKIWRDFWAIFRVKIKKSG